ncbi:MAG: hypothetical protein WC365_06210 [Candidatus Babeliales bacterium]|jgi:hypothetical protein
MIYFIIALTFAIAWGIAENRLFREQGEWWILNHFKQYHLFLFYLTFIIALLGCEATDVFQIDAILKFIFLILWTPWALDVTWWIIRFYDYARDYDRATVFYNEPNPWHIQSDWDNYTKRPLVYGIYDWWWIFGGILLLLGTLIIVI